MSESSPYAASDGQELPLPLEEALVLLAQAEEERAEADAELDQVKCVGGVRFLGSRGSKEKKRLGHPD